MRFFHTTSGGSRYVIIIGRYALKFPLFKKFNQGRRQNQTEWRDRHKSHYLARLYFSTPFGLCNIMERATPLNNKILNTSVRDYFKLHIKSKEELDFILEDGSLGNFGVVDGKIVKIDWGGI